MSRTQIDFRGSSIQASSVSSGRVVSETPISVDARSVSQTLAISGATATVQLADAGLYVIDAKTSDSAWGTSFSVVKTDAGVYTNSPAADASVSAGVSGTWTPSITPGGLFTYTRGDRSSTDTIALALRKL
jgi:hypothetical protein